MSKVYFSGFYPAESSAGQKGSAAFLSSLNTATIYLYRRSTTALTLSDLPTDTITYTFETAAITGLDPLSPWKVEVPEGADPLYIIAATATSYEAIDTILTADWSTPALLAQSGLSSATVFLFQRTSSTTPPSAPSVVTTYTFATGILDNVNNGWSQTAPDSSAGRYLYVTTAFAVGPGETDDILTANWATVKLLSQDGVDGTDSYTVYLSNESHTVPADSAGNVTSYTGATGSFLISKNGTSIVNDFTFSGLSNPQGLSVTYTGNTYTITDGLGTEENVATLTIRATGSGEYAGIVFDKVFTLSKSKSGSNGAPAKLLSISASRQIVTYDGNDALSPSSQPIVFSASKQNTSAVVTWSVKDSLGFSLTASSYLSATTGDSVTMTAAQFSSALSVNGAKGVVVTGTLTDTVTLSDTITVSKVMNGSNGSPGVDGDPGTPGISTATLQMYQWAALAPTTYPSGTSTYTWSTGTFTSPGTPNGWTVNPGTPVAGQKLWGIRQIYTTYYPGSTTNITWSATTVFAVGAAGTDGSPGSPGTRGSKQFYTTGTSWSDTTANNAITSAGFTKVTLDSVTISGGTFAQTRYWDGSAWIQVSTVLDGNLLVNGSVAADKIDSRGLSIKDASGNIILAAGSPLAASNITPSSGWLNSNVNITGSNGTISLTGAGTGSATGIIMPGNQITSANVSTYIASAAIDQAYIGNLSADKITTGELSANRINVDGLTLSRSGSSLIVKGGGVDTPQMADNAATNLRYTVGTATTYIPSSNGNSTVTLVSITFTPTYIPANGVVAIVNFSARFTIAGVAAGTSNTSLIQLLCTQTGGPGYTLWGNSSPAFQPQSYTDGQTVFFRGSLSGIAQLSATTAGVPLTVNLGYRMFNITPDSSTSCLIQQPTIQLLEVKK